MVQTTITPEILEISLRALGRGKPPAPALLSITGLESSNHEKNILALETLLYDMVWQAYASLRLGEGLSVDRPVNRQAVQQQIAENFRTRNGDLTAWTALYSRYFSGVYLSANEMALAAGVVPQQFRRRLKLGLVLLTQKLLRLALETEKAAVSVPASLPLPEFTSLVGVQKYFDTLSNLFTAPNGPVLVSLEGMGGIGKSALVRAFIGLPETAANWHRIAWVSARQTSLAEDGKLSPVSDPVTSLEDITARLCDQLGLTGMAVNPMAQRLEGLKAALDQEKHLIVIDNLETMEDYLRLVPTLGKLAGVSRFLITTRQTLRAFSFVHTITLKALDKESAFELIEAETARRGRLHMISAENFTELYTVIGGHPLALKLIAAQLFLRPLSEILNGFRQARGGIESLYRYLYWQTWRSLSDQARRLLLSFLPSDPDGEDLEFLQLMSGQQEEAFYASLRELDQFSLLEVNGDAERPLYRLHSLTITFLQTDILNLWAGSSEHD